MGVGWVARCQCGSRQAGLFCGNELMTAAAVGSRQRALKLCGTVPGQSRWPGRLLCQGAAVARRAWRETLCGRRVLAAGRATQCMQVVAAASAEERVMCALRVGYGAHQAYPARCDRSHLHHGYGPPAFER
eukprot:jgi/Ulvmu1/958/UM102_0041.1